MTHKSLLAGRIKLTHAGIAAASAMLAFAATVSSATSHATAPVDAHVDNHDQKQQEITTQLPKAPETGNLLPFYAGPIATQSFAIDANSLTVGNDQVVRYTLVTTSASGVKNISHEGIRCDSLEKKVYAFGRADGTWSQSHHDRWDPISHKLANRYHAALANDYFCQNGSVAGDASAIVNRIRQKRSIN